MRTSEPLLHIHRTRVQEHGPTVDEPYIVIARDMHDAFKILGGGVSRTQAHKHLTMCGMVVSCDQIDSEEPTCHACMSKQLVQDALTYDPDFN